MTTHFVGVAGLPRSGSTLLCQLLAQHPLVHSEGHSSPLCSVLLRLRHGISDDDFFLAQLDVDFERTYEHLKSATRGFVRNWYHDCTKTVRRRQEPRLAAQFPNICWRWNRTLGC